LLLVAVLLPFMSAPGAGFVLPDVRDGALLLILAIACTLIPFAMSLAVLRHLSAFTTQLAVNLEPVYSIFIAVLFLAEGQDLGAAFFVGVVIVMGAVFGHASLQMRQNNATR